MPISATWPLTITHPCSIQASASRREQSPNSAMRLFKRTVVAPEALGCALETALAGRGARAKAGFGGG